MQLLGADVVLKISRKNLFAGEQRASTSTAAIAGSSWHRYVSVVVFILLALAPPAAAQTKAKNVLVLSGGRGRESINRMASSLRARFPEPVNFSIIDLENPRFDQNAYQEHLAEALRSGYSGEKLDLVVAVMTPSLQFALKYRDEVFPGVPVVFMSINPPLPEKMGPGVTGVESPLGTTEIINLALRLHPDTEAVAVITDVSDVDKDWLEAERGELLRHRGKVKEIDLIGPPSPELLQRVAALPPHTVVLFQLFPQDANQLAFGALDVLAAVVARLPTYSILSFLDRGVIGVASYDATNDAVLAGQLAARVLSGERADDIPIVQNSNVLVSVDWRQLRRWNIPESALPAGTRVLYSDSTFWQRYWKYVIAATGVILVQSFLIVGLLWQRARRQKAEFAIRESEQRFRLVTNTAPVMIWMSSPDKSRSHFNRPWLDFTGRSPEAEFGTGWAQGVHPEDLQSCLQTYTGAFDLRESFHMQYRLRRHDGEFRWIFDSGVPRFNADASFAGYIGSCLDITERKLAEEALASLGGKLIAAEEQERTRIARELHDDINQQLAFLSMSLDELRQNPSNSIAAVQHRLEGLGIQASEISTSVQALSHRLHSSKLEYLGLVAALRGFCSEFADQHHVEVKFSHDPFPESLPPEISLCLFRIVQAALVNALKHSGVKSFDVHLQSSSGRVHLRVHDGGVGFDVEKMLVGRGLGLISMRERVRFVNGEISIQSKPNGGTTIEVGVSLPAETVTSQSA
jgi:PAS domain S-box-containing protein